MASVPCASSANAAPSSSSAPSGYQAPRSRRETEMLADRQLCEALAARVVESYGQHCLVVVSLPWSSGVPPAGVLSPRHSGMSLDGDQLQEAIIGKDILFLSCSFVYELEQQAVMRIMQQLVALTPLRFIVAGQASLPSPSLPIENMTHQHQIFLKAGGNDVVLAANKAGDQLKLCIKLSYRSHAAEQELMRELLADQPPLPDETEMQSVIATHQGLLFEEIPRELMPHFATKNPALVETEHGVGEYIFTSKITTRTGISHQAIDAQSTKVVVRVWDKEETILPSEVENIYRELRFLQSFIQHPNVVQVLHFLHGSLKLYLVTEFVGKHNLGEYLYDFPGQRLTGEVALDCFHQLADGVLHCHEKHIVHRCISLEHIVVGFCDGGGIQPKLVDFRHSVFARGETPSRQMCGTLPCIPPEVLSGEPYLPKRADCWSTAVVLLEMAGGKGSFFAALGLEDVHMKAQQEGVEALRAGASTTIFSYFEQVDSHAKALRIVGDVNNAQVLEILVALLQPEALRGGLLPFIPARNLAEAEPALP